MADEKTLFGSEEPDLGISSVKLDLMESNSQTLIVHSKNMHTCNVELTGIASLSELLHNGFLQCKACNHGLKEPIMLPCLDTVCSACASTGAAVRCPVCGARFVTCEDGAGALESSQIHLHEQQPRGRGDDVAIIDQASRHTRVLPNAFVEGLLRLAECRSAREKVCDYCRYQGGRGVAAAAWCVQCGDSLCGDCAQAHLKTKLTRSHSVLSFKEIQNGGHDAVIRSQQLRMCTEHEHEIVIRYCATCNCLICRRCRDGSHDSHDIQYIDDVGQKTKESLATLLQAMKYKLPSLNEYYDYLTCYNDEIMATEKAIVDSINNQAAVLHKAVEASKNHMIATLRNTLLHESHNTLKKKDSLEMKRKTISNVCVYLDALLAYGRNDEILSISTILHERLTQHVYMKIEGIAGKLLTSFESGRKNEENGVKLLGCLYMRHEKLQSLHSKSNSCVASSEGVARNETITEHLEHPRIRFDADQVRDRSLEIFGGGNRSLSTLSLSSQTLNVASTLSPTEASISDGSTENSMHMKVSLLLEFDSKCPTDTKDVWPTGIGIHPDGDFYVVDRDNKCVKVFDCSGKYRFQFGGTGESVTINVDQGKLQNPCDIAVTEGGLLLLTDYQSEQVKVFSSTGQHIRSYSNTFKHPRGIAVTKSGQFIVADSRLRQVSVHDPEEGEIIRVLGGNSSGSNATSTLFTDPHYVALTPSEDRVLVTDWATPHLKVVSSEGTLLNEANEASNQESEQTAQPYGVAVDNYGNVLMADNSNHRIHMLTTDGVFLRHLITKHEGLWRPMALKLDYRGNLVVTEALGRVKVFKYL